MRVTAITFDKAEHPQEVTLTMSVREAALLVRHCANQPLNSAGEDYEGTNALYDALTGMVFNAYYDNGVDDYFHR